jgi:four helix bundle protein
MAQDYTYRNLILWQKAQDLGYEVIQITRRMSQNWANAIIARQIIASATSVAANIAEGHGRLSLGAHRNHLSIARGSATETDSWLDLMRREGIITIEEEARLHNACRELIVMLTSKMRDLDRHNKGGSNTIGENVKYYASDESQLDSLFPFTAADYSKD